MSANVGGGSMHWCLAVALVGLLATCGAANAQNSPVVQLREAFVRCVNSAVGNHAGRDLAGVIERAFADCRTEENALYSLLANAMTIPPGFIGETPPAEGALMARSMVDRLKLGLKNKILMERR